MWRRIWKLTSCTFAAFAVSFSRRPLRGARGAVSMTGVAELDVLEHRGLALAGLGLGIAVLVVVWVVVNRGLGTRRLMTSDLDVYRCANELIKEHGLKGASDYAADRIAELMERGGRDGAAAWRNIRAALLDLSDVRFGGDAMV